MGLAIKNIKSIKRVEVWRGEAPDEIFVFSMFFMAMDVVERKRERSLAGRWD